MNTIRESRAVWGSCLGVDIRYYVCWYFQRRNCDSEDETK